MLQTAKKPSATCKHYPPYFTKSRPKPRNDFEEMNQAREDRALKRACTVQVGSLPKLYVDPASLPCKRLPTGQPIPSNFTDAEVRMFAERELQLLSYYIKMQLEADADFFQKYGTKCR